MPRPSRPWFRFYVEALADRKLRRLDPATRWVWLGVLGMARMSPAPGVLLVTEGQPADEHDLADVAGVTLRLARSALDDFERSGMVERHGDTWHVTNWARRQFESDDVTERTRKHRSKERSNEVAGNAPETETDLTTPQPPASGGPAEHDGSHPNCRACGTNRRGKPEPAVARSLPPNHAPEEIADFEHHATPRIPDDFAAAGMAQVHALKAHLNGGGAA